MGQRAELLANLVGDSHACSKLQAAAGLRDSIQLAAPIPVGAQCIDQDAGHRLESISSQAHQRRLPSAATVLERALPVRLWSTL